MKRITTILLLTLTFPIAHSQLLNKMKQKAEQAVDKATDKAIEGKAKEPSQPVEPSTELVNEPKTSTPATSLKVFSKFDFVPGTGILYFDNFEKDNIGETPSGWITSSSAEVVTIEGLEGNWLKLIPNNSKHISRNKKQSWGNNFTVEFDLLFVKNTYDPRIDIALLNTGGNLVTDENILAEIKPVINFSAILRGENTSRASLYAAEKRLSDNMTESLTYSNTTPVHISMCVQGKRFRMWWNDRKLYDLSAISPDFLPNQLAFTFGSVGGSDFYISNIRIAKDVPDTRASFEQGKLVSNLLFFSGTANLKPESMGSLLDVSKILKDATGPVKIVGHTDSDGADNINQQLSEKRAATVKKILVEQYSIDAGKLTTEGRGETQPIADNKSAEGKAQNRRVEFIFKPEADVYVKPAAAASNLQPVPGKSSTAATKKGSATNDLTAPVNLQSSLLTTSLPFAQFVRSGENRYTFIAGKEEGNSKENDLRIQLETTGARLKPEAYFFKEINAKQPLYGTKKYPEIKATEAVLYYGASTKPYIYQFSPVVANGHMASYISPSLASNVPAASPNCKFVIEKLEDEKASGYFTMGIMIEGLKPITKGDAMQQTFTNGFSGDMKCTFTNVPVY